MSPQMHIGYVERKAASLTLRTQLKPLCIVCREFCSHRSIFQEVFSITYPIRSILPSSVCGEFLVWFPWAVKHVASGTNS